VSNFQQGLTIMVLGSASPSVHWPSSSDNRPAGAPLPPAKSGFASNDVADEPVVSHLGRDSTEEEIAAAIIMALAYLHSYELCRSRLGEALEDGPGQWWTVGQVEGRSLHAAEVDTLVMIWG